MTPPPPPPPPPPQECALQAGDERLQRERHALRVSADGLAPPVPQRRAREGAVRGRLLRSARLRRQRLTGSGAVRGPGLWRLPVHLDCVRLARRHSGTRGGLASAARLPGLRERGRGSMVKGPWLGSQPGAHAATRRPGVPPTCLFSDRASRPNGEASPRGLRAVEAAAALWCHAKVADPAAD